MLLKSRLLYLPCTKGTIQNEHILLHPLIIEINVCTELEFFGIGVIYAYVSYALNWSLTA